MGVGAGNTYGGGYGVNAAAYQTGYGLYPLPFLISLPQ